MHSTECSCVQACAALEKQLKFATDRIERADEEKKELQVTGSCRRVAPQLLLQEVLRAWEAENLRLRTQVVKLMEQQVVSAGHTLRAEPADSGQECSIGGAGASDRYELAEGASRAPEAAQGVTHSAWWPGSRPG